MSTINKVIEYKDDDLDVRLTINRATVRIGMMRTLLQEKARVAAHGRKPETVPDDDLLGESELWVQIALYPSLIAATTEATGFEDWPLSYDQFMELPETLAMEWESAVFELNPHWRPKLPETDAELEEVKKK